MKQVTILAVLSVLLSAGVIAQPKASSSRTLKESMTLPINESGGANGASIAWHPVLKRYYAAMAGNVEFPMMIFDAKGKKLSPPNLATKFDVRGFWYSPVVKALQANGYNDFGITTYKLDSKGIPASVKDGTTSPQPDPQSVGAYNPKKNSLYFFNYETVQLDRYDLATSTSGTSRTIYLGVTSAKDTTETQDDVKSKYNENAIVFTGIPNAEIGLLNADDKQIELYSLATGMMTQKLALPDNAPVQHSLNFTYANGIYWLFDKTERIWHGYK